MSGAPALLCTDWFAERYADRLAADAPRLELVALVGDGPVAGRRPGARRRLLLLRRLPSRPAPSRCSRPASRAPNLRWLHTFSAGTDHPIFGQFRDRGVRITTSSGANAAAHRPHRDALPARAQPRHPRPAARPGRPRVGRRGRSTTSTARRSASSAWARSRREVIRLAIALGMRPIGMRRAVLGDEPCETWTLDRLRRARRDRRRAGGRPAADRRHPRASSRPTVIDAMRPGAVFVNVGRGDLVDEPALVGGAADRAPRRRRARRVRRPNRCPADSPLWDLPNVIITPHNSANTGSSGVAAAEIFLANLARYVAGRAAAQRALTPVLSVRNRPDRADREGQDRDGVVDPRTPSLRSPSPTSPGTIWPIRATTPGRSPVPVTVLWAAKGGSGTTRRHRLARPLRARPTHCSSTSPATCRPPSASPSRPARASATGSPPTPRPPRSPTSPSTSTAPPA